VNERTKRQKIDANSSVSEIIIIYKGYFRYGGQVYYNVIVRKRLFNVKCSMQNVKLEIPSLSNQNNLTEGVSDEDP